MISLKLFPMVELTYPSVGSDDDLEPARREAIIWTDDG